MVSGLLALVVSIPIIVSVADAARSGWWPIDDHALTGLAAHDVLNGHPPVMGPRTTTAFESGVETHHPGPLLYYLLALPLAAFGGDATGLLVGSALITGALVWIACWAALRSFGTVPSAAVAAAFLGLQWALGPGAAVLPFNPYPPAFATLTLGVLAWGLARGHTDLVPHTVFVASLMIQAHISYLAFLAPASLIALVAVTVTGVVSYRSSAARRTRRLRRRSRLLRRRASLLRRRERARRRRRLLRSWRRRPLRWPGPPRLARALRVGVARHRLRDATVQHLRSVRAGLARLVPRSVTSWAAVLATVLWLPPAVELVRFYPHNNLQQVLRYMSTDHAQGLPFADAFLTGVGVLAPFQGGFVTAQIWQGQAVIATEPRSVAAVAMGAALLVCVALVALLPAGARDRLSVLSPVLRVLTPSDNESAAARVAVVLVMGGAALAATMPETSAAFSWNYLQLWGTVLFIWMAAGLFILRRLLWLLPRRQAVLPVTAALVVGVALLPALVADRTGRWEEGKGVKNIIPDVRASLAEVPAGPGAGHRHVFFETHSLGSTYGIAPSVAFGIKEDRPIHLGAIWTLPEDTDFRKLAAAPEDAVRIVIRDGPADGQAQEWAHRGTLMRTFSGRDGGWYTLVIVPEALEP